MSCIGDVGGRPKYGLKPGYERDQVTEPYPYEKTVTGYKSGDAESIRVIVLGPDTYASADGETILWRGVTYRREEPIPVPDPLDEDDYWRNSERV